MTTELLPDNLQSALHQLPTDPYGPLLPRLREVLADNVHRGRYAKYLARNPQHGAADYVLRVAETMRLYGDTPARLAARVDGEWEALRQAMVGRAYYRLVNIGVPSEIAYDRARDMAQKCCLDILQARPYPYDVPYVAWATRILYNSIACETQRSHDVLDRRDRLPLENWPNDEPEVVDPGSVDEAEQIELRQTVAWALAQLSPKQRVVITRRVFDEAPDLDTARELHSSPQAVQNHRHRGMQHLRELLRGDG